MNSKFWEGRRTLLTGHTGFKGGWLAAWLTMVGADVFGYALDAPTIPSFFEAYDLKSKVFSQHGDITSPLLFNYVDNVKPSVIFHLAAQPIVRRSYNTPISTFNTNVLGTANLLSAARNQDVKAIVVVTSDKCYIPSAFPHAENDPLGGKDPYSASKACQEIVTEAYTHSYFKDTACAVATVRAGNVIGGGDWAEDRLVPDIIRAVKSNQVVKLRYPFARRPWQHVLDPLHGYIMLAEKLVTDGQSWSGAWNFGPKSTDIITVGELATKIGGIGTWIHEEPVEKLYESDSLLLDCDKANHHLGWHPVLSLEDTIDFTVRWYNAFYAKDRIVEVTNAQIHNYMDQEYMRVI